MKPRATYKSEGRKGRVAIAGTLACVLACLSFLFVGPVPAAAEKPSLSVSGAYKSGVLAGNKKAALRLELVDGQIVGQLTDENGNIYALRGSLAGKVIQGKMFHLNRSTNFFAERAGASIFISYVPIDGKTTRNRNQRSLLLMRVSGSPKAASYTSESKRTFADFLGSYHRWDDQQVSDAFGALRPGQRALVQMFAYLHADLFIRTCGADKSPARDELGWSQSLDCDSLVQRAHAKSNASLLAELRSRAKEQASMLKRVAKCAGRSGVVDLMHPCEQVGIDFSPIASAWQDASDILPNARPEAEPVVVAHTAPGETVVENATTALPNRVAAVIVPTLKPQQVAEDVTVKRPLLLSFERLPVNWGAEGKAQFHEWALANDDTVAPPQRSDVPSDMISTGTPH